MASVEERLAEQTPTLGFRFGVFFFIGGTVPNPVDFRFRKVSGISSSIKTTTVEEGGQNLFSHRLPDKIQYENLVLERGMPVKSPLAIEFIHTMSQFKFTPSNVLVSLLDEAGMPVSSWLFIKAYPVTWSISDLDAEANAIVVETMELAYERFQTIRL